MFICWFGVVLIVVAVCVGCNFLLRQRAVDSEGKAVLITGCDRGFGYLLASHLSGQGYRVFAGCLDANGEGATKLRKASPKVVLIQLDVTSDQQTEKAREFVEEQLEDCCLWAVVNNAGIGAYAEAEWCPLSQYQAMMDVNWLGTVRVTKAFLPLVRAARGRVVNLVSLAGRVAPPAFTCYSSSKFAAIGFSDSLRREMVKFGVKVITIEPSLYATAICDRELITRQNTQMWASTSEEVRQQYGESYFRAFLVNLAKLLCYCCPNLHEVVDDLARAVTSEYPYTRYSPCLFTKQLPTDVFSVMPNCVQDTVLNFLFKIPALPFTMSKMQVNGIKAH